MSSVHLYIYDLSKGLARQLSFMFIGKHLEGIWHTGIVAYGREWFYGGNGIESVPPKGTVLGEPDKIELLGRTEVSENDFLEMVQQLSDGPFRLGTYNLLLHNCNTFSNQMAEFLVGKSIPRYIIDLPNEVLNTPIGAMLQSMFAPNHTLKSNVDDTPISHISKSGKTMPLSSSSIPFYGDSTVASKKAGVETQSVFQINEPILFKPDIKDDISNLIKNKSNFKLDNKENSLLDDLKSYLEQTEITWSISNQHVKLLYKLLENVENVDLKLNVLKIFQKITIHKDLVTIIKTENNRLKSIIGDFKEQNINLIENYFQWFTNMASNYELNEWFMNEQDFIFSNLTEYILYDLETNKNIHQFCVTFFYNLLCIFDRVYTKLSESSSLSLGCALIELIHSERFENDKILYMLDLLQVCCAESADLKVYIESIGGLCLNKYIHDEKCKSIIETINKHLLIKAE